MSKKLKMEIADRVNAITYEGCVTIEYFSIVNGKKTINMHNKGEDDLFESIVQGFSGKPFETPRAIVLGNNSVDNIMNTSFPYRTTPLLYHATYQGNGVYTYSDVSSSSKANCLSYEFTIPRGSVTTGTKITKLKLVSGDKVFASVLLGSDKEITVDASSNIQIYWRLIFKSLD